MKYIPSIIKTLRKYGVVEAGIFGSVARGEASKKSDLDLMIRMGRTLSLFEYIRLNQELEKQIGVKVDLVNKDKIKPVLRPFIMKDVKYLEI